MTTTRDDNPADRLVDQADPSTWGAGGDPRPRCAVCGTTNHRHLTTVNVDRTDLLHLGLNEYPVLCITDLRAVMQRLGSSSPQGRILACSRCQSRAVVATWPLGNSTEHSPTIRACRPCLAGAITELAAEHSAASNPQNGATT